MRFRTFLGRFASVLLASLFVLSLPHTTWAQPRELNPVMVTATRFELPLADVLPSASVISREQIETSQATTLADLLQGQAGFEFGRNGGPGTVTSFFLRGQDSTNMVLLIDGVRVQADAIGSLTLTEFPLALIEKIEILRGNAGALYGEAAIGGVISIHTRQAGDKPQVFGASMVGSYQSSDIHAGYLSADTQGLRFNFVTGHNQSNGFTAMNPAQNSRVNSDRDGYRNDYLQGKIEKKVDSTLTLGARISLVDSRLDYDRGSAFLNDISSDTHQFKKRNDSLGLYVNKQLTSDWLMRLDVATTTLNFRDYRNGQQYVKGDGSSQNGLMKGDQQNLKWTALWQADSNTTLNFGLDTLFDNYKATGDDSYDVTRTLKGVFAGFNRQWDQLTLQINARHDSVDVINSASGTESKNVNSANTGLLGLGWKLNTQWRITSAISSGFRAPTAYDVYQMASLNVPNLKPESHRSKELGLVHAGKNSLSKLVYFESTGKDVIDYDYYPAQNVGETRNNGWEGSSSLNWGSYKLRLSAVIQNPWSVSNAEVLARRAKHYGSADVARNWHGYDVGMRVYAAGERKDSPYTSITMSGYSLWSMYVNRRLNDEWSAQLKLDNLFDRQYQLAYGYNTPGRGLYATLRYQAKP